MKYLIIFFLSCSHVFADTDLNNLLDKIDRVYKSDSSESKMKMTIITPHWQRSLEMLSWTKGLEKTFITILSPRKEKGISTLKKNNEMWNYFPKVNKVIKVPPSMMMGQWMGSDFTNDDLVKENTYRDDYTFSLKEKKGNIYTIELIPKPETITVWGKLQLVVDKKKFIPLKQDYYDEKGVLVRTMTFEEVKKVQGRNMPMKMVLKPLTKPGHETIVEYTMMKFDSGVKDSTFSLRNLQKRR